MGSFTAPDADHNQPDAVQMHSLCISLPIHLKKQRSPLRTTQRKILGRSGKTSLIITSKPSMNISYFTHACSELQSSQLLRHILRNSAHRKSQVVFISLFSFSASFLWCQGHGGPCELRFGCAWDYWGRVGWEG